MVPVVVLGEDPRPPARQQGEEPGRQVPGGVDGVAAVEAEADADSEDGETHEEGDQLPAHTHVARGTGHVMADTCLLTRMLLRSVMAQTQSSSSPVPSSWSPTPPQSVRCGAG